MSIDEKIRDETLQYDISKGEEKISGIIKNWEILPFNQRQIIKQAKFIYSPLGKAFEKQTKAIEEQGRKQIDAQIKTKDLPL